MQEGGGIEAGIDSRYVNHVAAREQWGILHAEAVDLNGERRETEGEAFDFDLLSGFLLEVGNYLGAVAIDVYKSWYRKK
jgi:hypothetical protein